MTSQTPEISSSAVEGATPEKVIDVPARQVGEIDLGKGAKLKFGGYDVNSDSSDGFPYITVDLGRKAYPRPKEELHFLAALMNASMTLKLSKSPKEAGPNPQAKITVDFLMAGVPAYGQGKAIVNMQSIRGDKQPDNTITARFIRVEGEDLGFAAMKACAERIAPVLRRALGSAELQSLPENPMTGGPV